MGFDIINWSDDTNDAVTKGASVQSAVNGWLSQRRTRIISLQHDLITETVAQVPAMIDAIQKSGQYQFKTVGQCTGLNPYGNLATGTDVVITSSSVAIPTTTAPSQTSNTAATSATTSDTTDSSIPDLTKPTGSAFKASAILGYFLVFLVSLII